MMPTAEEATDAVPGINGMVRIQSLANFHWRDCHSPDASHLHALGAPALLRNIQLPELPCPMLGTPRSLSRF